MTDTLLARVLSLLAEVVGPGRTPAAAHAGTPLGAEGFWLDSVAMLEAIIRCEETFGVTLDVTRAFGTGGPATVGDLADAIRKQL